VRRRRAFVVSLFSLVLIVMAGHESEHVVQLFQKDALGQQCPQHCRGALGAVFDNEPVHFVYNVSILALLIGVWLLARAWASEWRRERRFAWAALTLGTGLQIYHVVEHCAKLEQWLTNGHHSPTPGFLGKLLPWHGITLVELHFGLNTAVFVAVVTGYLGLRIVDQIVPDRVAVGLSAATIAAVLLVVVWPVQAAAWATDPPLVHLTGASNGPLVLDHSQRLVGRDDAIVHGGLVVRANHVTVSGVTVVGGEYGIEVEDSKDVLLKNVTVINARLDGIHVRHSQVTIKNCRILSPPAPYTQGIDISFSMDLKPSVVDRCRIEGGAEGIVTHSTTAMLTRNQVSATTLRAIDMTEMSMGMIEHNEVTDARGIAIFCGDHSECMVERNDVANTRPDTTTDDLTRQGFGIVSHYGAVAEIGRNSVTGSRGLSAFAQGRFVRRD
jgi:hypothetical protein